LGLSCGVVGLPNSGKTTIFSAITLTEAAARSSYMFSTTEPVRGTVDVPDPRLAEIAKYVPTKKVVPAQMTVVDIPGLVSGSSHGEGMGIGFLGAIKESDVLLHVVRCFTRADVQSVSGKVDPAFDAEVVDLELGACDLDTLGRNLERTGKKARAGDKEAMAAQALFERCQQHLQGGAPLRTLPLTPAERTLLQPLFLMTVKPVLFVANVGDDDLAGQGPPVLGLRDYARRTRAQVVHLCGDLEAELVRMPAAEREAFQRDFGLTESGLGRLIHAAFDLLGLQTYFTAGEKEVRAWVIHKGDVAPVAAGVIHTDFSKKFVRAEVYQFADLVVLGSEAAIKAAGKLRLEGKDYVMRDGDVAHFLVAS
jgi:hypothetical protein